MHTHFHLRIGAVLIALLPGMPAFAGNWPTFAGSSMRLNYVNDETLLTPSTVTKLRQHWSVNLAGPSATQPLFMQQVASANGTHDEVFQTTMKGRVVALNAATGAVDWSVQLPAGAPPCSPGSTPGVHGTPTIDPATGLMYVVDATGLLHALAIASGAEGAPYPVQVISESDTSHGSFNHSSPTLDGATLYITTSANGSCEQMGSFRGSVIAFDTQTHAVSQTFYPLAAGPGGGIWGAGGVMADSVTGRLFVATGNALTPPAYAPMAESVVALAIDLTMTDSNSPGVPLLSPKGDLDFGSTPTPIDIHGCPPLLSVMNKTGDLMLYRRRNLHHGPVQVIAMSKGGGSSAFIGMAAYDPVLGMLFIDNPLGSPDGTYTHGAVGMIVHHPGCTLAVGWQTTFGAGVFSEATKATDPVVAGGVVWFVSGAGNSVLAFAEVGGALLWSSGDALRAATTTPVTVADGQMFVQSGTNIYAWGL
jgi:outer membrane protein assembly factor BamB